MKVTNLKIVRLCTVPLALLGYKNFLIELSKLEGIDLHILTSRDGFWDLLRSDDHYSLHSLDIEREINFKKDFISLLSSVRLIRTLKPNILHSNTPKGGLVSAIAGFLLRVPVRIHTFTGQRWLAFSGFKRFVFVLIDRLILTLNTHCLADSKSQADFLNKVLKSNKVKCLGDGSFGGIDLQRFNLDRFDNLTERKKIGLSQDDFIILYLGRVTKDKGIEDLLEAFDSLSKKYAKMKLLIVGPYESELDRIDEKYDSMIGKSERIYRFEFTNEPEKFYSICDLFCLPSYREGFGSVILEAAAMKKTSIGSDIYGISDAIIDNKTGLLFKMKSISDLSAKIEKLYLDRNLREEFGVSAYQRVVEKFNQSRVASDLNDFYRACINEKNI